VASEKCDKKHQVTACKSQQKCDKNHQVAASTKTKTKIIIKAKKKNYVWPVKNATRNAK